MTLAYFYLTIAFIFTIANRLYSKYVLGTLDSFGLALVTNFLAAFILLPFILTQFPEILNFGKAEIILIILSGMLWTYVAWLGNLSIAQNNFSFKEIIRQTRIIWVVLAGIFILGEQILLKDILGIALIVISVYIISWKQFSFKEHISSKPILLAWSVAFVAAAIAILDKYILSFETVPVSIYAFFLYFLPGVFLLFFLNKKRLDISKKLIKNNLKEVLTCSVLMLVSYYAALEAYNLLPISIAYPLIQTSSVVGVLIGTMIFEENKDWQKKLLAVCLAVAGVLVIKLV